MQKKIYNFESGCLIIIALPFAVVSVGVLGLMIWYVMTWVSMFSWQEVPAFIKKAELSHHRSDQSTTFKVVAHYTYEWEGREYTGTRVLIQGLRDNVRSFHQRIYRELSQYRKSGKPFRCYVNPEEPSQAILYRGLRMKLLGFYLLFFLVFGSAGFGFMGAGFYAFRKNRDSSALMKQQPARPWRWKPEWKKGIIPSQGNKKMIMSILFTVFWNAISFPVVFSVPGALKEGDEAILFALIFPVIGFCLLCFTVYQGIQWLRFGNATFQVASVPGALGGSLNGLIRIPVSVYPEKSIDISLNCIRRRLTGSGDDTSISESIIWQGDTTVSRNQLLRDGNKAAIPVCIKIPFDLPATDNADPHDKILWRLTARAEMPGVDFKADFEVPVFRTPESDPAKTAEVLGTAEEITVFDRAGNIAGQQKEISAVEIANRLRAAGLRLESCTGGGIAIIFPMMRQPVKALFAIISLVICGGFIMLMSSDDKVPPPLTGLFCLFFVIFLLPTLNICFGKGSIEVNRGGIYMKKSLFGLGRQHHILFGDIQKFDLTEGVKYLDSFYYSIVVIKKNGSRQKLASHLLQKDARMVIQALHITLNYYNR